MKTGILPLNKRPAWKALKAHYQEVRGMHLRKLFEDDPKRGEHYVRRGHGALP